MKGKGEKERSIYLNAEFQKIARRDKVFLSEQCKEIEENNKMGKISDLFNSIGDIMGIFCTRTDMIQDRNSKDLTETKQIKEVARTHRRSVQKRA